MSFNERTKGFTLIELLVVVAIIAIASAASIPMGLSFLRNYNISGAANNIGSQMQKARSQAVKLNTQRGVLLKIFVPKEGRRRDERIVVDGRRRIVVDGA